MDEKQLFEVYLASLTDCTISTSDDSNEDCVVTAEEQRLLLRLAYGFLKPQVVFGGNKMPNSYLTQILFQLCTNPQKSPVIEKLLFPSDYSLLSTIRPIIVKLPSKVNEAVINLHQIFQGNMAVNFKTLFTSTFRKDLVANINHVEGFPALVSQYITKSHRTDPNKKPNFNNYREQIVQKVRQTKNKATPYEDIEPIRFVNISSDIIYDKDLIDPLRKLVHQTMVRSAVFNEINVSSVTNTYNMFVKFIFMQR